MSYEEFKNKWLGKPIDYDGKYLAQCVDVYRMYVKEVLGCPQSPPVVGAKDIWNTYLPEFFNRIENSTDNKPEQGDIVIWGMNPYGHIAICDHATLTTLTCFEQNWVEGNGSGVAEIRRHTSYNNVLGWLRFKLPVNNDMTEEQKRILDFIGTRTEGDVRQAFGALADFPNLVKEIEALKKLSQDLAERVAVLESENKANNELILDWQSKTNTANSKISKLEAEVKAQADEKNIWKNRYEQALKDQVNKYTGWQLIRMGVNKLLVQKSK